VRYFMRRRRRVYDAEVFVWPAAGSRLTVTGEKHPGRPGPCAALIRRGTGYFTALSAKGTWSDADGERAV